MEWRSSYQNDAFNTINKMITKIRPHEINRQFVFLFVWVVWVFMFLFVVW